MRIHHLFFGLVILLTTGCNQQGADNESHQHGTGTAKPGNEAGATTLTLNEGQKWKLDEPTRENIKLIREAFEKAGSDKPAYTALGADLQAKSNKLVSECRMSGKDHDMLHIWLTGYLSSLKEMNSGAAAAQEKGFHDIESHLKIFDQYFE